MKKRFIILEGFILGIMSLSLCKSPPSKNEIFWVSSVKSECSSKSGKTDCLNVYKGESLDEAQWENIDTPIEGFTPQPNYLKKIEIKVTEIKNPPEGGAAVQYIQVNELEKKTEIRVQIQGKWVLAKINDTPAPMQEQTPTINIDLPKNTVFGTGPCNRFSGKIKNINEKSILLHPLAPTRKACPTAHIEPAYFKALESVKTYSIKEGVLLFFDDSEKSILSFTRKNENASMQRLNDNWVLTQMGSSSIKSKNAPRMEINLNENRVTGNDSCNRYMGPITKISQSEIRFGNFGVTRMACIDMSMATRFYNAMEKVRLYRLKNAELILFDKNDVELLRFGKTY